MISIFVILFWSSGKGSHSEYLEKSGVCYNPLDIDWNWNQEKGATSGRPLYTSCLTLTGPLLFCPATCLFIFITHSFCLHCPKGGETALIIWSSIHWEYFLTFLTLRIPRLGLQCRNSTFSACTHMQNQLINEPGLSFHSCINWSKGTSSFMWPYECAEEQVSLLDWVCRCPLSSPEMHLIFFCTS